MKSIVAFFIAALLTAGAAHAQSDLVTKKIDNRISAKFPFEPKEPSPGSYFSTALNGAIIYIISKTQGLDSASMVTPKDKEELASMLKTSMKNNFPDVDFSNFTPSTWKGFTSVTGSGFDSSKKKKYDFFWVMIGDKLYNTMMVRADDIPNAYWEQFYDSITLNN